MAEETVAAQNSQEAAEEANVLPSSVETPPMVDTEEYASENEQAKDVLSKYGETDVEQFIAKVTSNSVFARRVLKDMLGIKQEGPVSFATTSGARQEHNITGVLDHSEFPPKIKNAGEPETKKELQASDGVTDGTAEVQA
jgi:hypothetical protein